ncbi:uncharacterized protein TNCT_369851 [Trichonephila clavata]|uniref:SOWAHA-C winged helix-turn-helix domain-containing protein n=1 Tax=Trichonephila clavata TaxID=2740835 RepID=A0A8X6FY68_TRICU|nr:uncharacterized protein TNCT_369851 [Trichonephila clavata]
MPAQVSRNYRSALSKHRSSIRQGRPMEAVLNEHEVIKFLKNRGGRCTNFELVSNFRGVLNDPRYQAEARLKFKDIINAVATVGEYQNVKYLEIKKEFDGGYDAYPGDFQNTSEPSSLSSEGSRGSYSSPIACSNFQPYWRYRLSTTNKVALPPPKSPEIDAVLKPFGNDTTSSRPALINRSVSESVLPQTGDVRHAYRIPSQINCPTTGEYSSTSDINRYQCVPNNKFEGTEDYANQYPSNNVRRLSGNFQPDRMTSNYTPDACRTSQSLPYNNYGLNRSVSEHFPVGEERTFSKDGYSEDVLAKPSFHPTVGNLQKMPPGRDGEPIRSNHGKKPDAYQEDLHRNPVNDSPENSRVYFESPISRKIEAMHGIHRKMSNDSGYLTPIQYESPNGNQNLKSSPSRTNEILVDDQSDLHTSANLRNVARALFKDSNSPTKANRRSNSLETDNRSNGGGWHNDSKNFLGSQHHHMINTNSPNARNSNEDSKHSSHNRKTIPNVHSSPNRSRPKDLANTQSISEQNILNSKRNSTSDIPYRVPSRCSFSDINSNGSGSMLSLNSDQDYSESLKNKDITLHSKLTNDSKENRCRLEKTDNPPPLPPARKKKDKFPAEEDNSSKDNTESPSRDWSMASGKVRDRVQHFDDMEKKKNIKRSHSPLTPDKENRIHSKGIGTDDDVSISVLDSKLKREWFVKAAQSDYHALVALLKKEPKLAAIKVGRNLLPVKCYELNLGTFQNSFLTTKEKKKFVLFLMPS